MRKSKAVAIGQSHASKHAKATCVFCANLKDFDFPGHLMTALSQRRVIIFAGAGVSTEGHLVLPRTLYKRSVLNWARHAPASPSHN